MEMNCILKNLVSIFQSFRDHLSSKTKNAPWITRPAKYLIDVVVLNLNSMVLAQGNVSTLHLLIQNSSSILMSLLSK